MTVHDQRMEAVLAMLQSDRNRPIPAIDLASFGGKSDLAFGDMQHETKRRRVREVIDDLRKVGYRVCAGFMAPRSHEATEPRSHEGDEGGGVGYWMARDTQEWNRYLQSRTDKARFEFVAVKKMASAATDKASGQQGLFGGAEQKSSTDWAKV